MIAPQVPLVNPLEFGRLQIGCFLGPRPPMIPAKMFPLSEAIFRFATKREIQALGDIPEVSDFHALDRDTVLEQLPRIIPELMQLLFKPGTDRLELFRNLGRKIDRGVLVALGVRTKPHVGTSPEIIPAFLFENAKFDPQNNAIENAGNRFELVKVGRKYRGNRSERHGISQDNANLGKSAPPPSSKKAGRPSNKEKLVEIIRELQNRGELDDILQKEKINRIRRAARSKYRNSFPTPSQPSEQSIREAIYLAAKAKTLIV